MRSTQCLPPPLPWCHPSNAGRPAAHSVPDAAGGILIQPCRATPQTPHVPPLKMQVNLRPAWCQTLLDGISLGQAKPPLKHWCVTPRMQVNLRPTVCQTLLEGISLSQPQPKVCAELRHATCCAVLRCTVLLCASGRTQATVLRAIAGRDCAMICKSSAWTSTSIRPIQ